MTARALLRLFSSLMLLVALSFQTTLAQSIHPTLLDAGTSSDLPRVVANDNRTPGGTWNNGVLEINLDVVWADWRMEKPGSPGLRVPAIAESGKAPMIPGPLLRVETGTTIRARVRNTIEDSTITVYGLHSHPIENPVALVIPPGGESTVEFEAGAPGTYFYRIDRGREYPNPFLGEDEELAGAFIIDPPGGSPPDRVFMINIFSKVVDSSEANFSTLEALTINGLSWPYTERQTPAVGDTVRWRVINASRRDHPMHLHGFFYDVLSRGDRLKDDIYAPEDRRNIVTENMDGRSTMAMQWIPRRPGNWLFHCHLAFHVSAEIRLPGAVEADPEYKDIHMAGLVLGLQVQPGPSDLIEEGEPRELTLYANEYDTDSLYKYGFALDPKFYPDSTHLSSPGPLLVMKQYQPTFVTVENRMSFPTGIHWHGLELDAWADGVPGWSASDGRVSPAIQPGERFTYKLSLMRPGTFIYHSHLDDVHQLTGGLYGALLVMAEDDTYDPATDHIMLVGWRDPEPLSLADMELNGRFEQPAQYASVGETHRIRLINIAPAGQIAAWMTRDGQPVNLKAVAKDGSDLPVHQQVEIEKSAPMGVGETADFAFTPTEPGVYELHVGYAPAPEAHWTQRWEVAEATGDTK